MINVTKIEQRAVESISQKVLHRITRNRAFSQTDYLKCKLGLEIFLVDFIKLIVIYTLALVVGLLWQVAIFHVAYVGVKLFAHGAHCKTNLECTFISCLVLVGAPAFINSVQLPGASIIFMFFINLAFLWRYAPSATKKNGIGNKRDAKKKELRCKAIMTNGIIFLISLLMPLSMSILFMAGALTAGFMTTPLSYKLLRQERI